MYESMHAGAGSACLPADIFTLHSCYETPQTSDRMRASYTTPDIAVRAAELHVVLLKAQPFLLMQQAIYQCSLSPEMPAKCGQPKSGLRIWP